MKKALANHKSSKNNSSSVNMNTSLINGPNDQKKSQKKPQICHLCSNSFYNMKGLNRHIESVHEKKKPYLCDICSHSFTQKGHLNAHIATVHKVHDMEKEEPYICEICSSSFSKKSNLDAHVATIHNNKKKNKIQQKRLMIKTRMNMFVIFAMLNFLIAMVLKDIFNLCMKRRGHIYVIFVVKVLLEKVK